MNLNFRRLVIVNRGEPAMRLIHAVRELNEEYQSNLRTIALYTEADRSSMFVREADEAFSLGPSTYVDPKDGLHRSTYLDHARLKQALRQSRAEAAWVGWGFVAEQPEFVQLCTEMGIVFIGPTADAMRKLGDKITSKKLAEQADFPVAAWSGGPITSIELAQHHAKQIGYPLLIKATAGGGGRGIRSVSSEAELALALERAQTEAARAFGDGTVYMEKKLSGVRHVEVQVVGDQHGTVWALGVRDCTIQRRNQKIIEEAPSPTLDAKTTQALREAAVRLTKTAGYYNAGTVECLLDVARNQFYFMEMNTRIQVEHPITEVTTGVDLVKMQLHIASGGRLPGAEPPPTNGHAIEVRINAEDPDNGFAPAPGSIELFRPPVGPGIRTDAGVREGDAIPPELDSMVAKLIVWGKNRPEALSRMHRALMDFSIVVQGGTTNKAFLLQLLSHPAVIDCTADIAWVDHHVETGAFTARPYAEVALIQAAIDAYDRELAAERGQFFAAALRGRLVARQDVGFPIELRHEQQTYALMVLRVAPQLYRILIEGQPIEVTVDREGQYRRWLTIDNIRHRVLLVRHESTYRIEVNGVQHKVSREDGGTVRAPFPALVLAVHVHPGDVVAAGDRLFTLEAMKMEVALTAPNAGRVRDIMIEIGNQVAAGAPVALLEQVEDDKQNTSALPRLFTKPEFDEEKNTPTTSAVSDIEDVIRGRYRHNLEVLWRLLLGYDVLPAEARGRSRELAAFSVETAVNQPDLLAQEDRLLETFIDLSALYRGNTDASYYADIPSERALRAEELLLTYLRVSDQDEHNLPAPFIERLTRMLAHYSVNSLSRTPELEEAMLRMQKAFQRQEEHLLPIIRILERRLAQADMIRDQVQGSFKATIDRMILAGQERASSIGDLARQLRFRFFDEPALLKARALILSGLGQKIKEVVESTDDLTRKKHIDSLIESPHPVIGLVSQLLSDENNPSREHVIEILLRRFYSEETLTNLSAKMSGPSCGAATTFNFLGRQTGLIVLHAPLDQLSNLKPLFLGLKESLPRLSVIQLDIYVTFTDGGQSSESLNQTILSLLNGIGIGSGISRICVGMLDHRRQDVSHYFTYGISEGQCKEVHQYRGVHPRIAGRLGVWRLRNFTTQRIPTTTDSYLYWAVATDNARDERLFAYVVIRDLTPIYDTEGQLDLPYLRQKLMETAASMRETLYQKGADRLIWNRIMLYLWPPLDMPLEDLHAVVRRLGPLTLGLGLEKLVVSTRIRDSITGQLQTKAIHYSLSAGQVVRLRVSIPSEFPVRPLTPYHQRVAQLRRRGLIYPYEIIRMLAAPNEGSQVLFPLGKFVEYDLTSDGDRLVPVERRLGDNQANIVVGTIRNITTRYPEGMQRVIILSDPSREMGALAEPECRRIMCALDLAQSLSVPVEWFAVSSGAKISMSSGTENLDWTARVLRRIIEFTQTNGIINVIVCGVNVGAQSYWNAEATMLMHTRGILVMLRDAAQILTGKRALDYSGAVSAEDNQGIGGVDRIMGPNGQAQYIVRDITEACMVLMQHHELTYVARGERFPRPAETSDPIDRNICVFPHNNMEGENFDTVGDIFSLEKNPQRKKPFDIRSVMRAAIDQDLPYLERWAGQRHAEGVVVWDGYLGGYPVCLLGFESRNHLRPGFVPADGPQTWSGATLFPLGAKKVARAINAASNSRPVVILANLSGFDGSPESMRKLQLEYGAEIGRAVVNFVGPIIFCVVSRYHGGAYVVFSAALNDQLEALAVEGAYASVIGGAPAAAVVFPADVRNRTNNDERIKQLQAKLDAATHPQQKVELTARIKEQYKSIYTEKQNALAEEFDRVHTVQRALQVGSLHRIVSPTNLRPYLIEAIERGMARTTAGETQ